MPDFRYSVVASSLHEPAAVDRIVAPVAAALADHGGVRAWDAVEQAEIPHVIVVATGGTETAILDVVARRDIAWEPVVLVAHRWHNSLPASLEALARLRADGRAGRIVQIESPGEPETTLTDLAAIHRLRAARLGLVGRPSEWLVASVPDRDAVRGRWGIDLVDVDIADTIAAHPRADRERSRAVAVKFSRRRPGADPGEPGDEALSAAAVHPALTATIERADVDAVTVRCFDFLGELRTSGCLALAELNDTGIVAGCEGDIAGAVAMLLVKELLGAAAWIANPASIDPISGRMVLAHCTVAPSLVDDVELHTHFESGLGIGIRGTFAPGPVTLLRLGGRELTERWIADAQIVGSGDSPDLCRTQVDLALDSARLTDLLERPLGNHLVLARGHHAARLDRWWRLAHG